MHLFHSGSIRNTAIVLLAATAFAAHAVDSPPEQNPSQDWEEPALTLTLPGGSGDELLVGEFYQVLVTAQAEGHLYIVQQNSQERGSQTLRLAPVTRQLPGYSNGRAFMYPSAGESLKAQPPLGSAQVQAIYSTRPLPITESGAARSESGEFILSEAQLETLLAQARETDPELRIAVESVAYEVTVAEGDLEFTTRGIASQINSAISTASVTPDSDGILTSFDAHIPFEFGSAMPSSEGLLQLDAFGDVLSRPSFAHIQLVVVGHTDDVGERDYNLDLSRARAKAVVQYLEENFGIPSTRMVVDAKGEDAPYVDNTDDESRALNRRVEFTLLDQ